MSLYKMPYDREQSCGLHEVFAAQRLADVVQDDGLEHGYISGRSNPVVFHLSGDVCRAMVML